MRGQRLLEGLFRVSLWLYPPQFRRKFGPEMTELFVELLDEARQTGKVGGVVRVAARSFAALPRGAALAWSGSRRNAPVRVRLRRKGDGMPRFFLADLRHGVRGLARSPVFALVAVASLALGLGANATLLTLVRAIIWSELPVPQPDRLVRVFERDSREPTNSSYANFRDLREQARDAFSGLLVHDLATFGLRRDDRTDVIHGELVSSDYFQVLGVRPAIGRFFSAADAESPADELTVVLSHHLWQEGYGGDPGVVGRIVELNGKPAQVAGVAPSQFNGTKLGLGMDVWVPLRPWGRVQGWGNFEERRHSRWLNVVGRLAPGVTLSQAQAAANAVAARLAAAYPDTNKNTGFALLPEAAGNFGGKGMVLASVIGAVSFGAGGLVLLVACGNVASLLIARGVARRREVAIRRALGASRGRLVSQFLAESLALAACATGLGFLLSQWVAPLLLSALPPLPYRFALRLAPDATVFGWMATAGLATAIVCGLVPALHMTAATDMGVALGEGRSSFAPGRLRALSALSALTLALCFVTLVLTGLFTRSLQAARAVKPGFETQDRALASVDVSLAGPGATTPARYFRDLLEHLGRAPGLRAALASNVPLTDRTSLLEVFDAARPVVQGEDGIETWVASVSESYFEVLGQPILEGRSFVTTDRSGPPVVIVGRALAQKLWPAESAIGKHLRVGGQGLEIVGVAADAKYVWITETPRPALFRPFWQDPTERAEVIVHGPAGDSTLASAIERAGRASDPAVPVFGAKALAVHLSGSLWMFRIAAGLGTGLGLLAAVLALAGLHGVMAYGARQRVGEIGIRLTLGASRAQVVATLVGRGARATLVGLGLGLIAALAAATLARSLVFGIAPYDPLAFLVVGVSLSTLAFFACLIPALSASRANPVDSLRESGV